jgi:hypothetical protein
MVQLASIARRASFTSRDHQLVADWGGTGANSEVNHSGDIEQRELFAEEIRAPSRLLR